jgi:pentatricopeptide repeat protein
VQLLEFRVALFPDNYEEVTNLAWLLESMEMTDQTEAVLTEFYRQNPTMPDASFPIAHFHFRRNNYAETVRYLSPSIRMTPRPHPNTFRTLALAYERLGRLEEAIKVWDLMLSFTEDGAAVNNRARVRQKLEERKEQSTPPSRLNDRSITLRGRWSA